MQGDRQRVRSFRGHRCSRRTKRRSRALLAPALVAACTAGALGPVVGRAGVAVADTSGPPSVVSVGDASVLEGNSTRTLRVPVTLSRAVRVPVTVNYVLVSGSASGGAVADGGIDFNNKGGAVQTLTFTPAAGTGETALVAYIAIPIFGDTTSETNETFTVVLSNPTGGFTLGRSTGTATVLNDDTGNGIRAGVGDTAIVEGDAGDRSARIPVVLTAAPGTTTVRIPYTIQAGTAVWGKTVNSGNDYGSVSTGTLTFTGTATAKDLLITIYGDTISESDETVRITLGAPTGATTIRSTGTLTILNGAGTTPSTTTIATSSSTVTFGQLFTLQATVAGSGSTPSGIVQFFDGAVSLGYAPVSNGQAAMSVGSLVVGAHSLRAQYAGDSIFAASQSPTITQTVQAPALTTSCSGVSISPGQNIQAAIDARPTATTFCFAPGVYTLTGFITPKAYDRLISTVPGGAVLTGNDLYNGGIQGMGGSTGQHHVTIQGFAIGHMVNSWNTWPRSAIKTGDNWTVANNDIGYNTQIGIEVGTNTLLSNNVIHHNGRYGFAGGPLAGLVVDGNEIAYNNTSRYDAAHDAGGSKIVGSSVGATQILFTNNYVHDNYGNGLWCDTACKGVTYRGNRVERNLRLGIFHEASDDATISGNIVTRNCTDPFVAGKTIAFCSEIGLNDSKNVEIAANTVTATYNGVGLYDIDRGSGVYGTLMICNDRVHDNAISMPAGGVTGAYSTRNFAPCPTSPAATFTANS